MFLHNFKSPESFRPAGPGRAISHHLMWQRRPFILTNKSLSASLLLPPVSPQATLHLDIRALLSCLAGAVFHYVCPLHSRGRGPHFSRASAQSPRLCPELWFPPTSQYPSSPSLRAPWLPGFGAHPSIVASYFPPAPQA